MKPGMISSASTAGKASRQTIATMEVSALAAVMIALLAAFTVENGYHSDRRSPPSVDLVKAGHSRVLLGAMRENALHVSIERDSSIYFAADRTTLEQLAAKFPQRLESGAEQRLYIEVDAHAKYAAVIEVLNAASNVGIERVSFVTR